MFIIASTSLISSSVLHGQEFSIHGLALRGEQFSRSNTDRKRRAIACNLEQYFIYIATAPRLVDEVLIIHPSMRSPIIELRFTRFLHYTVIGRSARFASHHE
jgi:hypothetical protein